MDVAARITRRIPLTRLVVLGALLFCLALLSARLVDAHAELTSSDPGSGSALAGLPDQIALTFSESIDPALSSISLLNSAGARVALETPAVDSGDPRVLAARVIDANGDAGVYTVVWGAYSAEDGHTSSGSFTFSAGTGEAPAQSAASSGRVDPWLIVSRWLELIGLILMSGLALFSLTSGVDPRGNIASASLTLTGIGLVGALVGFWARTVTIAGNGMISVPDRGTAVDLLGSTFGRSWVVRVAVLLVALALSWLLRRNPARPVTGVLVALGGVGLATIAASGHSGAVDTAWLAALVDWMHMSAAAVWLGGLLGLLLVLSPSADAAGDAALLRGQGNRFAVAILIIIGAGAASTWWHVGGRRSLGQSDYGQTLLFKIAVVAGLLGVAWYNRRVLQDKHGETRRLIALATGLELVFATVVLLFSADLTQTPPARQPLPVQIAARAIELDQSATVGETTALITGILTGDPTDRITIEVTPADALQRVIVRTQLDSSESGELVGDRFDATPIDGSDNAFIFPAGRLGIAGPWELNISIRRAGVGDVVLSVPIDTSSLEARGTRPVTDEWGGFRVTSHTLLALALAAMMLVIGLGGMRRITGLESLASAFLLAASLLIAGGFLVSAARSVVPETPGHLDENPLDTSPGALTYAGDLYRLNCAACHGTNGRGVGNADAAHLHGDSADLTRGQTNDQSDGDLRYWIGNGVPGTRMPAFDPALSEEEQWQLVALIRKLQEDARLEAEAQ